MATPSSPSDSINASSEQKHVTRVTILIDLIICVVFFVVMFGWVRPHVPSNDPFFSNFFGASTTLCITGVVWMAINMFRIVAAGEKTLKAERAAGR